MPERLFGNGLKRDLFFGCLEKPRDPAKKLVLKVKIGLGNIDKRFISTSSIEKSSLLAKIENEKQFILEAINSFLPYCQTKENRIDSLLVHVVIEHDEFEAKPIASCWYEIFRENDKWWVKETKKC